MITFKKDFEYFRSTDDKAIYRFTRPEDVGKNTYLRLSKNGDAQITYFWDGRRNDPIYDSTRDTDIDSKIQLGMQSLAKASL